MDGIKNKPFQKVNFETKSNKKEEKGALEVVVSIKYSSSFSYCQGIVYHFGEKVTVIFEDYRNP